MDALPLPLLDGLVKGSALILMAALSARLLRNSSAAVRHAIWTAALLVQPVLLMCSFVPRAWSVPLLPPIPIVRVAAPPEARARLSAPRVPGQSPALAKPSVLSGADAVSLGNPAVSQWSLDAGAFIWALWLAGFVAILGRLALGTVAVARLARRAVPVRDERWLSLLRDIAAAFGIRRPIVLLQSDGLGIPAVRGFLQPAMLLPRDTGGWSMERRRLVLAHELAHVKRHDAVTQLVGQLTLAVFWMNPLVWIAVRQMRLERERACDDYVLRSGTTASRYAHELLEMARALASATEPAFATLALAQRRSEFEARMLAILDPHLSRHPLDRRGVITTGVLALLLVAPLAGLQLVVREPLQPIAPPLAGSVGDPPPAVLKQDAVNDRAVPGHVEEETVTPLQPVTGRPVRCANGKVGVFSCQNVELLSFLPRSAIGGGAKGVILNSIWGWTDSVTGREFAIVGRSDGTAFVEVTDPVNPRYLGKLPLHEGASPSLFRDMKVYRDHAFIVADAAGPHGIQVFDLTQLRDVKHPPAVFRETAHYDRVHSVHSVVIDEASGYLYATGANAGGESCGSGLHMVDIHSPTSPTFAGCYMEPETGGVTGPGYIHDAQCVIYHGPDDRYRGREICLNSSGGALGIADVTNKRHPTTISVARYPNTGYVHQGWLTADQRYFFQGDELDDGVGGIQKTRTIVFDLTDLGDPVVSLEYYGTTPASDHNLYIRGRYMYQSNYSAGLRIADVEDPTHPKEVGYFDTFPDGGVNAAGFAGTWSNYPYFRNDVVGVTSMTEGLFLVRYRS